MRPVSLSLSMSKLVHELVVCIDYPYRFPLCTVVWRGSAAPSPLSPRVDWTFARRGPRAAHGLQNYGFKEYCGCDDSYYSLCY